MQEKVSKAAKWDRQVAEKLTALLAGQITQKSFKENPEAEESMEGEESEVVGTEDAGAAGGTQSLAMEVNKEGEDEVVVVEGVKQSKMRKRALSSPPKTLRKRV